MSEFKTALKMCIYSFVKLQSSHESSPPHLYWEKVIFQAIISSI